MTRRRRAVGAAILGAVLLVAPACSTKKVNPTTSGALGKGKVAQLEISAVPLTIGGLKVTREDLGGRIEQIDRSYVEAAALYGLRAENQTLEATVQVAKFTAASRYQDERFLAELRGKIGSGVNVPTRLGNQVVYLQSGTNQRLAIWTKGRFLYVLATRNDYGLSRSLLRTVLDLEPNA